VFLLVTTNTLGTLLTKYCNRQKVDTCDDCGTEFFVAPFFQTFLMFCGESGALIIYYIDRVIAARRGSSAAFEFPDDISRNKPPCPFYMWCFPAAMDLGASVLSNYSLVFTDASIVTLLGNFRIIITCALSLFMLRVAIPIHSYFGVLVSSVGMVLTGVAAFQNTNSDTKFGSEWVWIGVVAILLSTLMHSFQFVYEESLYRKYSCSPMKAVGIEGVFGLFMMAIILPILEVTDVERFSIASYQINHHAGLCACIVVSVFNTLVKNVAAQTTSKLGSALLRAIWTNLGRVLVWIFDVAILQWAKFTTTALIGFLVIILGIATYHNLLFPCWKKGTEWMAQRPVYLCLTDANAQKNVIIDPAEKEEGVVSKP